MIQIKPSPKLSSQQEKILQEVREDIEQKPHLWDGPVLLWLGKNCAFRASYAWGDDRLPGKRMVSILALRGLDGWLWQKRSSLVELPDLWDFSAAGAIEDRDIEKEVRREALEEIGQRDLQELSLVRQIEEEGAIYFLWRAVWSGEDIIPNKELQDWIWSEEVPQPSVPGAEEMFSLLA